MEITFWGVRGSIAVSGAGFARTGGNTTCVEVAHGRDRVIIDAGTGLRALGEKLLAESRVMGRRIQATMLFTHLHWDHIQGFPFFAPAYRPDTELELFGPSEELREVFAKQMQAPTFPVPLEAMASSQRYRAIGSGDQLARGPFDVSVRALTHPQGSLGYRIEAGGKSFCFATDVEHPEDGVDEALIELARDVDLLVYDAQYTVAEYEGHAGPSRKGWGHSTYVAAAEIARACGAKQLALFHHDPTHGDDVVEAIEHEARQLFGSTRAAREGQTIRL